MISPVSKAKVSDELSVVSFGEIANNETKWRLSSNVHREQKERNVGVQHTLFESMTIFTLQMNAYKR